jgi:hypothetical protein
MGLREKNHEMYIKKCLLALILAFILPYRMAAAETSDYPIVDTGQDRCFNTFAGTVCPDSGQAFTAGMPNYQGDGPACGDNGDGTVTDLTTGLMWQKGLGAKKSVLTMPEKWRAPWPSAGAHYQRALLPD